ncbi:sulfotransferase [Xanthobacteraceae bacterium A53D]
MLCQRVLAIWPGQPDALHILGLMAHAFGNLDLAIQHLQQACLSPRAPAPYLSNLAEMLRQKGDLRAAEIAGRRATTLDPAQVSGWNNLGIILQEAGLLEESVSCLVRVIALTPASPEAHNNLGNTYTRLGQLEEARAHYGRALELNPAYAEAESNMAFLLNEIGQFDAAAEAARRAIELNPRLADAYINLAGCEAKRLRPAEALHWLEALLSFAPGHAGGWAAQARMLRRLDRLDSASAAARRAVSANPHSADAHNASGEVLQAMGRHEEAFAAFDMAAGLPGLRAGALVNRAILQMELGLKAEALSGFDAIIAEQPDFVPAWIHRVDLKRFAADDPDIASMEQLLRARKSLGFDDCMALHFALGKAYLDAGLPDPAFSHLATGNSMKRATFAFDVEATGRWMGRIADTFTPALFEQLEGVGCPSNLPIFVLGMPRSGTTLIEQILASHPAVHGAGELLALEAVMSGSADYPAGLSSWAPTRFAEMGEAYVSRVRPLAAGRRHVVDKMPANFIHAGLIRLLLPQARIIHCRRDPLDTCLSCYTKLFSAEQRFAYDFAELGRFHRHYQALTDHWRSVLPATHFIEVTYEDVVADLEGEVRRLLAALGLPFDARCLAFNETPRQVRTASFAQVREPIYTRSAGRGKAYAAHLVPLLAALDDAVT